MQKCALAGRWLLCTGLQGGCLLMAQAGPGYVPGPALRADFEGKHRIVARTVTPATDYKAGPALRVDFEGKHRSVPQTTAPAKDYKAGPALRMDFEGKHRVKPVPK